MADVSDDAEQTPTAPIATPAAPSPQMFARPAAPESEPDKGVGGTADQNFSDDLSGDVGNSSRFASTGDPRVDRALAQLPDPDEHRREAEQSPARSTRLEDAARVDAGDTGRSPGHDTEGETHNDEAHNDDNVTVIDLPDPGLLDAHLADVTSVHRQLQQRLSDLSG